MEKGHVILNNIFRDLRNSDYYFLAGVIIDGIVNPGDLLKSDDKLLSKVDSIELSLEDTFVIRVLIPDDIVIRTYFGREIVVFPAGGDLASLKKTK